MAVSRRINVMISSRCTDQVRTGTGKTVQVTDVRKAIKQSQDGSGSVMERAAISRRHIIEAIAMQLRLSEPVTTSKNAAPLGNRPQIPVQPTG